MPDTSNLTRGAAVPIADAAVVVCRSPDPQRIFCYSPGLCRLASGRLVATCDWGGPGVGDLPGGKAEHIEGVRWWQGCIYLSDDHGTTWRQSGTFPFLHARPFVAGGALYVLGHAGDLMLIRSDDGGESWSQPVQLTRGQAWHQAPCATVEANGCVYLVMERRTTSQCTTWPVSELAPVLMRGRLGDDLTRVENWTFSGELSFREAQTAVGEPDGFGLPFFDAPFPHGSEPAPGRGCAPIGWLEANVVRVTDPDHVWYDGSGRTLHLLMRAHTGGTGYGCLLKMVEDAPGRGAITPQLEQVPSGRRILWLPVPGGQMKFHVVQDDRSGLYWQVSSVATRSMTRADRLPAERYNLPNNERRLLQLQVSQNLVDWRFAGLVAAGASERESRHYASMVIDGDDLLVLSRSGDSSAATPHNVNLITSHRVRGFRTLAW